VDNHFKGLSQNEVELSRQKNGSNSLTQIKTEGFWQKFLGNFNDPIIKILIFALIINLIFVSMGRAHWYESTGIISNESATTINHSFNASGVVLKITPPKYVIIT